MNVGDKATWTHVSGSGKTMTMSLREGVVESIDENGVATMKKKKGRELVAVARLRAAGQKSQITEFVEAVVEANRDKLPQG